MNIDLLTQVLWRLVGRVLSRTLSQQVESHCYRDSNYTGPYLFRDLSNPFTLPSVPRPGVQKNGALRFLVFSTLREYVQLEVKGVNTLLRKTIWSFKSTIHSDKWEFDEIVNWLPLSEMTRPSWKTKSLGGGEKSYSDYLWSYFLLNKWFNYVYVSIVLPSFFPFNE